MRLIKMWVPLYVLYIKGLGVSCFVGKDLTATIRCSPVIYEPIRAFPNGGKTQSKEDI